MSRSATLDMLVKGGLGLRCWCATCHRGWVLDARPMAAFLGPGFQIPDMRKWVACTNPECPRINPRRPDPEVCPDWPSAGTIVRPIP